MSMRGKSGFRAVVVSLLAAAASMGVLVVPASATTTAPSTTLAGNGSIDEAWLVGAHPGDQLSLRQWSKPVANPANPGVADTLGSLIIRNLQPGPDYAWLDQTTGQWTPRFSVLAPGANPPVSSPLYTSQPLQQGINYITVRDGIKLAATVRFPYGVTCSAASPCPTVVEYSGYNVAGPTDPIPSLLASATGSPCTNCGDPNLLPDGATDVGAVLARLAGFATVSLQMRGSGCSGGAFDLFGYPSDYDAYDAIEIAAHQSWVANGKVGMVGISFSGLSQLPSAGTNPPGLAAIAPLSPTDDLFSTGYPGGIYNNGFAAGWLNDRVNDAKPAAAYSNGALVQSATSPISHVGQPWTYYEIDAELAASNQASSTCLTDQALHLESQSLTSLVGPQVVAPGTGTGRDPSLFDRRSMIKWAGHVGVPVFLSGALQDEQTGPQWPALINAVPKSTPLFANMVNGDHIDSLDPQIVTRWLEFLDIYVANKVPAPPNIVTALVLDKFAAFGASVSGTAPLPAIRFTGAPDVTTARAQFASQTPLVTVLFDNGAGSTAGPGGLESTYSAGFASWPPAGSAVNLYLGPGGTLQLPQPATQGSASLTLDPTVRPSTSLTPGGNVWAASPPWNWTPVPAANGIAFQSGPAWFPITIVGPATLNLWVKASTPVVDLQATITEVRPDGKEEYVTSGFLRSTWQVDSPASTSLFTDPVYLPQASRNLSASQYRLVRIPIDPIAQTFRTGTELRVVLSAPGGDRPAWTFDSIDAGQQATVGLGGVTPSSLTVNVAPAYATATDPVCGTLRGQPCRAYTPENNQ